MAETLEIINVKYFELALSPSSLGRHQSKDYVASCPFCGDGSKRNSKRLHLFTKSGFDYDIIKCFNGDCVWEQPSNMYKFLQEINPALYQSYIQELKGEKLSTLGEIRKEEKQKRKEMLERSDNTEIITLDISEKILPDKIFNLPIIFKKIQENSYAYKYLVTRGLEHRADDFLEIDSANSVFMFKDTQIHKKELKGYIVIPLYFDALRTKIYGFTTRNTKEKDFYTRIPEENTGWKVWNWYGIDKDAPVYIFEAVFDAMSITNTNVIACLGADLPMDKIKELKEPIFVFDNDATGRIKSLKYASLGYKVMIWGQNKFKDTNSILVRGASKEKIQRFIDTNTYKGLSASVRLKV